MTTDTPSSFAIAVDFTNEHAPIEIPVRRHPKSLTDHTLRSEGLWLKSESELTRLQQTPDPCRLERLIRVNV